MKLKIFAIRDRATDNYSNPQFMVSTGQAIRMFSDEVNNKKTENNQFNMHPGDFDLYELGEYETNTGLFNTDIPKMVAIGKDQLIKE